MICSALIPSRARFERLQTTLRSIFSNTEPGTVEALIRFDFDDTDSLSKVDQLAEFAPYVRTFTGPRMNGYLSLAKFYTELAGKSKAPWVWIMNDDATLEVKSPSWIRGLEQVPISGSIVQPKGYGLNASRYWDCEGTAFPFVPNNSWKTVGFDEINEPADEWLDRILRKQFGWKTVFLDSLTILHDRDDDEALAEHRTIGKPHE